VGVEVAAVRVSPSLQPVAIARVAGAAAYLPEGRRTSDELEARIRRESPGVSFPPGIVELVTGIRTRAVAADHEQTSDLAAAAGRDALLFAAASQDLAEPATANLVQEKIGTNCPVFDVKNACNSFICGVQIGEALIAAGTHRTVLVTVGEIPSRGIKWRVRDREDLRLSFPGYTFGDAGAAVVLTAAEGRRGIFYRSFRTVSRFWDIGTLPGGGSMHPRGDEWTYFRGDGSRLGEAFASVGPGILHDALDATGTGIDDYARFFVHQVTMPFLKRFVRQTGVPEERLVVTLPELGNIAAATMPVQLAIAYGRGEIGRGDLVAWVGLAGGISIGVLLMEL
jgi:3-oxoacyl-[acyl-carrier-protein] synthase-3